MSSESDVASEAAAASDASPSVIPVGEVAPKVTKAKWKRGSKSTATQRAAHFPGKFEARGDAMWRCVCHVPVKHSEKTTAKGYLDSATHKRNEEKKGKQVVRLGPAAKALPLPPPPPPPPIAQVFSSF